MQVLIIGSDLPGRRCGPHENVHIGLCDRGARSPGLAVPGSPWKVVGLVSGDAPEARWACDVVVKRATGRTDFGGPHVRGNRDDRHLGLAWCNQAPDGSLEHFAGIKLRLEDVDERVLMAADRPGRRLVGRVGLSGGPGRPRSASIRPPDVVWTDEPA